MAEVDPLSHDNIAFEMKYKQISEVDPLNYFYVFIAFNKTRKNI